jgi:hypothetical protein
VVRDAILCICRWRELAAQLTHEERDPLYNEWNALWQENVVLVREC